MDIAFLGKDCGRVIYAKDADYPDYKGLLKCTVCRKIVFLRKGHTTKNGVERPHMFVHRKRDKNSEICELRVKQYTKDSVDKLLSEAKGQLISKIRISLWKYLKTTLAIDLTRFSEAVAFAKIIPKEISLVEYGMLNIFAYPDHICDMTFKMVRALMESEEMEMNIFSASKISVNAFLKESRVNWDIHCDITKEVLEVFLIEKEMRELRYRLMCVLCYPPYLKNFSFLLPPNPEDEQWSRNFIACMSAEIILIFLGVNWVKVFEK